MNEKSIAKQQPSPASTKERKAFEEALKCLKAEVQEGLAGAGYIHWNRNIEPHFQKLEQVFAQSQQPTTREVTEGEIDEAFDSHLRSVGPEGWPITCKMIIRHYLSQNHSPNGGLDRLEKVIKSTNYKIEIDEINGELVFMLKTGEVLMQGKSLAEALDKFEQANKAQP